MIRELVIGGLITSTLLTLLVVPAVYTLLDDFSDWVSRRRAGVAAGHGAPEPEMEEDAVLVAERAGNPA